MTYESKIDEMIGKHVAEYQAELTLAKKLDESLVTVDMPNGYPDSVYHPGFRPHPAVVEHYIKHTGGVLSNKVPRVISMELVGDYPLGIYFPKEQGQ